MHTSLGSVTPRLLDVDLPVSDAELGAHIMSDEVLFTVKNPAKLTSTPYKLRAKLSSRVSDLKQIVQREYDGHPDPQVQTVLQLPSDHLHCTCNRNLAKAHVILQLIYAGKVLRDGNVLVKEFIRPVS